MRNSLIKLQYVLFALSLLALAACGVNDKSASSDLTGNGSVTAKIAWPDGKTSAKSTALVADIVNVQLVVSGPAIPTAKGTPVAKGSNPSVEVYPGSDLIVAAYALDAAGNRIYEGFVTGVTVAAGPATDVGTIQLTPVVVKAADTSCVSCHEATRGITGQNLVTDYKQSGHYTNTTWTANAKNGSALPGCAGCHGTQHQDLAPSASGRCFECHGASLSLRHTSGTALTAGDANPARYLNLTGTNCSACHEPHNPLNGVGKEERKDWAASGHGNVNGLAWVHYDFSGPGRGACSPCHTPEGFKRAIGDGWTNTADLSATTRGKQSLSCDACHSSNDFKNSVRTLSAGTVNGGYKAAMTGFGAAAKAYIQFPNVGESNICIPCHAGRESGDSLKATVTTTYVGGFKNPHYLAAAQTFYGLGGFQFYTSGVRYNKYGAAGKVGAAANWNHGRLGMDNYSGSGSNDLAGKSNSTGNKGQCVACHLGPKNAHSFSAADVANATKAGSTSTATVTVANGGTNVALPITRTCYGCHKGNVESKNLSTGAALVTIEQFIDEEKEIWHRIFDFYKWQLEQYGIYYNDALYPYFFQSDLTTAFTAWNATVGTTFGGAGVSDSQRTMGTAMNIKLLVSEKGSFVHNRAFGRALMADSIAYLQKGDDMEWYNVVKPTHNELIKFSDYSAARPAAYPGQVGPNVSITTIKGYLTRTATGGYTRR